MTNPKLFLLNIPRFLLYLMSQCSFDQIKTIGLKYLIECFLYITVQHLGTSNSAFLGSYRLVGLLNKAWRGFEAKLFLTLYIRIAISCNRLLYKWIDFIFLTVIPDYFVYHEILLLKLFLEFLQVSYNLMLCRSGIPVRNMLGVVELLLYNIRFRSLIKTPSL